MAQVASDWFLSPFGGMLLCPNYVPVSIDIPGWRKAMWEGSILCKTKTESPKPMLGHESFFTLTSKPCHIPNVWFKHFLM